MTVVSGLRNQAAEGAGVHTVNPGTWLSCTSPFWPKTGDPLRGISADQIAARELGADTPFPSLELCTEVKPGSGQACSAEFGCGMGSTISFRTASAAAADGAQPAQAVLPLVRARRHGRRARGDRRADGQPARSRQRRSVVAARPARPRGPSAHGRVSRLGARDRAASAEDGRSGFLEARLARRAGRRAGRISTSTSICSSISRRSRTKRGSRASCRS